MNLISASDQSPTGRRGPLIATFLLMVIVLGILVYLLLPLPGIAPTSVRTTSRTVTTSSLSGNPTYYVTMKALTRGGTQTLEYTGLTPISMIFTAQSDGTAPFTYAWDFGDGTNSSIGSVEHTFASNCAYDVHLLVTDARGVERTKDFILATFSSASSASATVLCPKVGTAGISSVIVEGGFAPSGSRLQLLADGALAATTTVWRNGYFADDISSGLAPKPNGSTYTVQISQINKTRTFTTVEGVRVTPSVGVPGTSILVEGRSYPPFSPVSVYLGSAFLGTAQADGDGSFQSTYLIPSVSPLIRKGNYEVTTEPPVLGAQAFVIVPTTTASLVQSIPDYTPWILAAVAAVIVVYLVIRRRRRREKSGY